MPVPRHQREKRPQRPRVHSRIDPVPMNRPPGDGKNPVLLVIAHGLRGNPVPPRQIDRPQLPTRLKVMSHTPAEIPQKLPPKVQRYR
ncbi:hypothetical protein a10_08670 [Streptomyces acidiscabies]|nr:hypothetical protein a10_08670 [Streptomyces acidiscabies]